MFTAKHEVQQVDYAYLRNSAIGLPFAKFLAHQVAAIEPRPVIHGGLCVGLHFDIKQRSVVSLYPNVQPSAMRAEYTLLHVILRLYGFDLANQRIARVRQHAVNKFLHGDIHIPI